jgi:hypothetical protein
MKLLRRPSFFDYGNNITFYAFLQSGPFLQIIMVTRSFFLTNYEKVKNFILQKYLNHKTSYKILIIFLLALDFPFATFDDEVLNENLSCNFCYNLILLTMIIIVTFYAFFS